MCLSTELWTLSPQSCIANVQSKETECHSNLNTAKFHISLGNSSIEICNEAQETSSIKSAKYNALRYCAPGHYVTMLTKQQQIPTTS